MKKTRKARFATVLFGLLIAVFAWAAYSLFTTYFTITSYWGVGFAFSLGLLFMYVMLGRTFGYLKGFLATLGILLVVTAALILNSQRGWPFGLAYYHGILGWKFYKVAWPIPVFWSAVITGALLLKKPVNLMPDPKILFSWAFDTALITMILSLIIEPLAKNTLAVTWVTPGSILGVPASALLGWFITSFIAAVAAILILKPWAKQSLEVHYLVPLLFTGFFILLFIFTTKQNIALLQIVSAILVIVFIVWTLRLKKNQNPAIIAGQNEAPDSTEAR